MIEQQLEAVIRDLAQHDCDDFLPTLINALSKTLAADYVFIANIVPATGRAQTLFNSHRGLSAENFSYSLQGTPCDTVTAGQVCIFNDCVQELFPEDQALVDMGVQSYMGFPLHSSNGELLAILTALFPGPITHESEAKSIFIAFSRLIAGELERQRAFEDYRIAAKIIKSASEAIVVCDPAMRLTYVNPTFEKITGYSSDEVLGKTPSILSSGKHDKDFYDNMYLSLQRHNRWTGEIWNRKKNGDIYPEWLTINVIHDEQGDISHFVGFFADISDMKHTQQQLNFQMNFDPLTELPNLQLFLERVEQAKHATDEGDCIAVALIDIDNFRSLNDSFGHEYGNRVLTAFAKRMKQHCRFSDTLSRFSSDQFPLLITGIDSAAAAVRVIDDMHSALQQPLDVDGKALSLTFRAGLSLYPYDSLSAQELFSQANQALAYTKDASDNRYRFFTPAMQSQAERRITLKHKLETALREQAFTMAFQPIVDMRKGEITKFEALVRWHSDGQWVGPDEFIPVAEEFGLIQELGEQVLEMSLNALKMLRDAGHSTIKIAINRSIQELPETSEQAVVWLSKMQQLKIPCDAVCFEITESVLAPNAGNHVNILQQFRKAGCDIAIDDFGTGYSSLSYLRQFPANIIKIDRSFISGDSKDETDWALVESIIAMAHVLNLDVVAEGIETELQLQRLAKLGCDYIQGYHISRPLPAEQLIAFIEGFQFNHHWVNKTEAVKPKATINKRCQCGTPS